MYVIPTDVNECETGEALCDINANCTDTEGSYLCQCHPGFSGDGFNCSSELLYIQVQLSTDHMYYISTVLVFESVVPTFCVPLPFVLLLQVN